MGVDVEMKVLTAEPLTDEEFAELQAAFHERFPADEFYSGDGYRDPDIARETWDDPEELTPRIVRVDTLERYYGPGYERGSWPAIRDMGDWLTTRFGETAEVRYGDDTSDEWRYLRPWPEVRAECDEHYAKVGHLPYRTRCSCEHCATLV